MLTYLIENPLWDFVISSVAAILIAVIFTIARVRKHSEEENDQNRDIVSSLPFTILITGILIGILHLIFIPGLWNGIYENFTTLTQLIPLN